MKNFSDKIVVTGGSGLVGSHIIGELIKRGADNISVPLRTQDSILKIYKTLSHLGYSNPEEIVKERCVIELVQLNNPHEISSLMDGVKCVYNCAANVSLNPDTDIVACNVELTTHVINAAIEAKVGLFIHVSSIATLSSSSSQNRDIDESSVMTTVKRSSPYTLSKFYSENVVRYGAEFGLPTIIVNPSVILGEGDWNGSSSASLIPPLTKGLIFSTQGVTGYVDVRDVARAIVELSATPEAIGEQFILSSENLSFMELMTKASKVVKRRAPFINIGEITIRMAYYISFLYGLFSGKPPRLNKYTARTSQNKNYYNGTKVHHFIDFKYTPIDDTISRTVNAYLKSKDE